MGGIADKHVEWAIVNRLKAMLDAPPKTKFNVTQSFALFSAILLWTKQRAWVGGDARDSPVSFSPRIMPRERRARCCECRASRVRRGPCRKCAHS
jgi:hypothetical protein